MVKHPEIAAMHSPWSPHEGTADPLSNQPFVVVITYQELFW